MSCTEGRWRESHVQGYPEQGDAMQSIASNNNDEQDHTCVFVASTVDGDLVSKAQSVEELTLGRRKFPSFVLLGSTSVDNRKHIFRAHRSRSSSNGELPLRHKLAEVTLELAREKENLHLAASAGSALVEQLEASVTEQKSLHDQLGACNLELDLLSRDNRRLKDVCAAMASELQHYESAWTKTEARQSASSALDREQTRTATSANSQWWQACSQPSIEHDVACRTCERHEREAKARRQENEELKRRCIELELQQEQAQAGWSDLSNLHKKNESRLNRVQNDYTKALADIDYMTGQIKYLKEDHCNLIVMRDNLRTTNKRLQADFDTLTTQFERADQAVKNLRAEKSGILLQCQVLENRVQKLEGSNSQCVQELSMQSDIHEQVRARAVEFEALQHHTRDLEHLLDDSTSQLAAAKLQNQQLLARLRNQRIEQVDTDGGVEVIPMPLQFKAAQGRDDRAHHMASQAEASRVTRMIDGPRVAVWQTQPLDAMGAVQANVRAFKELECSLQEDNVGATQTGLFEILPHPPSNKIPLPTILRDQKAGDKRERATKHRESYVFVRPPRGWQRLTVARADSTRSNLTLRQRDATGLPKTCEVVIEDAECLEICEGDVNSVLARPLYLGLSILICATAVRYIVKR